MVVLTQCLQSGIGHGQSKTKAPYTKTNITATTPKLASQRKKDGRRDAHQDDLSSDEFNPRSGSEPDASEVSDGSDSDDDDLDKYDSDEQALSEALHAEVNAGALTCPL